MEKVLYESAFNGDVDTIKTYMRGHGMDSKTKKIVYEGAARGCSLACQERAYCESKLSLLNQTYYQMLGHGKYDRIERELKLVSLEQAYHGTKEDYKNSLDKYYNHLDGRLNKGQPNELLTKEQKDLNNIKRSMLECKKKIKNYTVQKDNCNMIERLVNFGN